MVRFVLESVDGVRQVHAGSREFAQRRQLDVHRNDAEALEHACAEEFDVATCAAVRDDDDDERDGDAEQDREQDPQRHSQRLTRRRLL